MKKILLAIVAIGIILGVFYFFNRKEALAPAAMDQNSAERANVENYLRENISKLSPVQAVLGGTWYVVSSTIDLETNSGMVEYEDGHIQETRNFSYTTGEKGEVTVLTIDSTPNKSGITGVVTLSPTCSVERVPPDPNCVPKFYSTSISIIRDIDKQIMKTVQSDEKGAFSVDLLPDVYTLQAQGGKVLPRCGEVSDSVKSGQYTAVQISCDTGIR